MKYVSVSEAAEKWRVSDRMVRKYCNQKLIDGAFLVGTTWIIPEDAHAPKNLVTKKSRQAKLPRRLCIRWARITITESMSTCRLT